MLPSVEGKPNPIGTPPNLASWNRLFLISDISDRPDESTLAHEGNETSSEFAKCSAR
jgi:hypothetical protein